MNSLSTHPGAAGLTGFRNTVGVMALVLALFQGCPAYGQGNPDSSPNPDASASKEAKFDSQGEATLILQHLFGFKSPYQGLNSLTARSQTDLSTTATMYLGDRVAPNLELYINPELAWGNGVSGSLGLAGYSNGDIIGQPVLRSYPYLARYFVRWRVPMPHIGRGESASEPEIQAGRAPNIIAGKVPSHRLVITAGKFAASDIFDVNSYANNPRTQFLNNAFVNNLAYDFAEDTRGYDLGLSAVWVNPNWIVRFGTFAMPTAAGGSDFAYDPSRSHSEQLEGEIHTHLLHDKQLGPAIFRLLTYRNVGDMGSYSDALEARLMGMPPDVSTVTRNGAVKYGFGLNFEQPLSADSATGLFGRLGWNDGSTESFMYTDCDRFLSFGLQVGGSWWKRKDDRVGVALAQSDLSSTHAQYLEAGGMGLDVGDGALSYGSERILESYYSYQISKPASVSLDLQYIQNPGYNRDRGPATLLAARLHYAF